MWESFGPTHYDRLNALVDAGYRVDALELSSASKDYVWERAASNRFKIVTLGSKPGGERGLKLAAQLVSACLRSRARDFFFCHYERTGVLFAAIVLRLLGRDVYTMIDSKFDDYPRRILRELGKSLFLLPYRGAITASRRSREYLRFLGIRRDRVELNYNAISIARIQGKLDPGADEVAFGGRPFLIVARLVPKKNLAMVIEAFAEFRRRHSKQRDLHIVGYGPLREELGALCERLGVADCVTFHGRLENDDVFAMMSKSLALVLASSEEQFGFVAVEAFAARLPAIVSSNAGVVDSLVENLGNGVIVNPDDPESLVLALAYVSESEERWRTMRERAAQCAMKGDAAHFAESVTRLIRAR